MEKKWIGRMIAALLFIAFITTFNYGGCGGGKKSSSGSSGTPTPTPTAPTQVTSPTPANGATNVPFGDISWAAASGATSYDVYFGATSPGTFKGNQAGTTYNPGTLSGDNIYYWRIDSKNAAGTTTGIVWSFTTAPWDITIVDSADDDGLHTDITIDSLDKVHISYYDATNGDLKYATNATGVWVIDSTLDPTDDVGLYTSIAIDSLDNVHISYYDATNGELNYATNK
ncbi:MAG: hypothetical protein HY762_09340 [Planctomycetes bacterium]|nr:hypothetical protein [Planctomycetota bacterium]